MDNQPSYSQQLRFEQENISKARRDNEESGAAAHEGDGLSSDGHKLLQVSGWIFAVDKKYKVNGHSILNTDMNNG